MNIGAALELPFTAAQRVLRMQTKLHCWATADRGRRFDDLFNLVADPCFLAVAWTRVRENTGARSAGIDKRTARGIEASADGVVGFLEQLREAVRSGTFRPAPVRRVEIPKASGKVRKLGIPTVADRVIQASLKLVLEPIFETDFSDSSYGFRPERRAQDAIEDIRMFAHRGYEWVFEADIAACFDEIDHSALLQRVRGRIGDKRILGLVKAFLKAGVLDTDGTSSVENVEAILERLIAQGKADAFYTCGSNRLFQLMKRLGQKHGIPGQIAMEQIMACGLGPCYVCVRTFEVDGKQELRRVCIEGPVFDLQEALGW